MLTRSGGRKVWKSAKERRQGIFVVVIDAQALQGQAEEIRVPADQDHCWGQNAQKEK
jgi:hypothetical protein